MKNKFLLLLLAGMSVFTACNDDDDKKGSQDLNGVYAEGTERNLNLLYSDSLLLGKSVEFTSADNETASLKLLGVIPGENETIISNVELNPVDQHYNFVAQDVNNARTIDLTGSVEKGKLLVNVKVKFAQNDLMGKWGLKESTGYGQPGAVHFDWEAEEGTALVINLPGADEPLNLTPEIAKMLLPGVLESMLGQYLQDVSFLEDGNIIATYNAAEATEENAEPEPLWKSSSLNLAHYRVNESICQVYPSIEMIMRQVAMDEAGRSNLDMTTILSQLLANGVPVHFTPVENGETTVYIDLEFLKQFTSFLPMIPALIPDDNAFKPMLVEVLNQLPEVLEKTTRLEIGLNLVKATEAK